MIKRNLFCFKNVFYFEIGNKKEKYILCVFNLYDVISYQGIKLKELERVSNEDFLTNLLNRRYLEKIIEKKIDNFKKDKIKFGLIFFDLDNFKLINDNLEHSSGDDILIGFSNLLLKNLREADILRKVGRR